VEEAPRPVDVPQWALSDGPWYVATPMGQCLARLPCDVRLGKMVLLSALFGGIEAVWNVAAALSHRSPLVTPFSEARRAQARSVHCRELLPHDGPPSDHMALNNAMVRWQQAKQNRIVETFCHQTWLSGQVLQTILDIRRDLVDSIQNEGFCETYDKKRVDTPGAAVAFNVICAHLCWPLSKCGKSGCSAGISERQASVLRWC